MDLQLQLISANVAPSLIAHGILTRCTSRSMGGCAVDAEGEVLDVLLQSKRDKRAALKLMRKLLKKMNFVPDKLVTDDLRSYRAACRDLGISHRHERGRWRNNRAETRISQPADGSARCRGSKVPGQPSDSCPSTRPPTTPSTFSAISPPPARTESSELRPCRRGARSPPRLEPSGVDGFAASAIPQRDNAVYGRDNRKAVRK